MARLVLLTVWLMSVGAAARADDWAVLDDFDTVTDIWTPEGGAQRWWASGEQAHSRPDSLKVVTAPQAGGTIVRAAWGRLLSRWRFTPDSRFRLFIYGDSTAHPTSSCIIFLEAAGRSDGRDSHWVFPMPLEDYREERWQEVVLPPLREATQPSWSVDADGGLDVARLSGVLLVVQQNGDPADNEPFRLYMDDLAATDATAVPPRTVQAGVQEQPRHVRPPIRGFVGRRRAHDPQVLFRDLRGWRAELLGGAEAELLSSREEPVFGEPVALLRYRGGGAAAVEMLPPEPIELRDYFNAADLWCFGNNWAWVPTPDTPPVTVAMHLVDAQGQHHLVDVGQVNWKFWFLMHRRIQWPAEWATARLEGRLPMELVGIRVSGMGNTDWRELCFDSAALYRDPETMPPFRADLSRLPFPTRPETILPDVKAPVRNSARRVGGRYELRGRGDEEVLWRYQPGDGTLSGLTVSVGGRAPFRPLDGAGPVLRFGDRSFAAGTLSVKAELRGAEVKGATVTTHWRYTTRAGAADYTVSLEARGKSLLITWDSPQGATEAVALGRATGLEGAKVFHIPYLAISFPAEQWAFLWNRGTWLSAVPDWYVTNCTYFGGVQAGVAEGGAEAAYAGSMQYSPLSDGRRNPVHERLFLTASSDFDEVLPDIPNPGPFLSDVVRTHLYTHYGGTAADRREAQLRILQEYKRYGIDHVLVTLHEDTWTEGADVGQGPQEYTMTLDGAPDCGGDAKLRWFMDEVRKLGYRVGPYTNYIDYSPNGASWDEANVSRQASMDWESAWPQTWRIRPLKAVEMSAYYAPRIHAKYGANTCYNDVHTALPPLWADMQAGTPGAGMMRTTFRAYGAVLMGQREAYRGPVFSEGGYHWYYAGLIDGSYAQVNLPDRLALPLMPDFDLRKIHPKSADISMCPGYIYDGASLHQSLAATIAYGHIGYLPESGVETACKVYYMMQPLQERYVHVPVDKVLYWDGAAFQTATTALPAGVHERRQVWVRYRNGLEVWVNCSAAEKWRVEAGGAAYLLPPYGWLARLGDEFLEFSAEVDGQRVDYMRAPGREYLDPGDRELTAGRVKADGPAAVLGDRGAAPRVIPIREGVKAGTLAGG